VNETDLGYKGVRGWLLLLCVNLTILDPFATCFNIIVLTNGAKPYFERYPGLFRLIFIGGGLSIILMLFSIYAGITLWKVLPNAVATAKKYLLCVFLYSILSVFLPFFVGLPDEAYRGMAEGTLINHLLTILYVAMWYLYLMRSRRVRVTYGVGDDQPR
jgi:hypothetical protein